MPDESPRTRRGVLRAVHDDRVVYDGTTTRGPTTHLIHLRSAARQSPSDEFGGERLFDRRKTGDVVRGEFEA